MYLLRRVHIAKPGQLRNLADLVAQAGKAYSDAGLRSQTRVYYSGGTVPGPANHVYMDWVAEKIESPFREGLQLPGAAIELGAKIREVSEESYIEFYEIYPKS